jgi:flagellar basal-body rod protein FlgF
MADRILEVGGAGLEGADARVKALMNNMVNSETPGYRKSDVVIKSFPTYLDEAQKRSSTQVPVVQSTYYDQSPGTLLRTGNKTDVAIGGDGYYEIELPTGKGYTRDGRFIVDQGGRLVTVAGNYPVVGLEGPIVITPGADIDFAVDGRIMSQNFQVNSVKIVNFSDRSALKPVTGSIFRVNGQTNTEIDPNPRVVSGYVEASNVNLIEEMMALIDLSHTYNDDTKVVNNRETMLTKMMDIGKTAQ